MQPVLYEHTYTSISREEILEFLVKHGYINIVLKLTHSVQTDNRIDEVAEEYYISVLDTMENEIYNIYKYNKTAKAFEEYMTNKVFRRVFKERLLSL